MTLASSEQEDILSYIKWVNSTGRSQRELTQAAPSCRGNLIYPTIETEDKTSFC